MSLTADRVEREDTTILLTNTKWPGGITVEPPFAANPYWRTAQGERYSFTAMITGVGMARVMAPSGANYWTRATARRPQKPPQCA